MIRIYHLTTAASRKYNLDYLPVEALNKEILHVIADDEGYVHCANIDTDNLDTAFEATQNIDDPWPLGKLVERAANARQRSSSVGDIFVLDGKAFFVAPHGFKELEERYKFANILRFAQFAKA